MIFLDLFFTFFIIGLFTFGGGYAMIPMIRDQVTQKGWMSVEMLKNFIAISECTPGPFAINIATAVGNNVGGFFGAICSTIGVILPSFIIILLVAWILSKFIKNRFVRSSLNTVQPIVISLILSTAIIFFVNTMFFQGQDISQSFLFDRSSFSLFILLGSFLIIYKKIQKKNLSPILMLIIAAGLGIIIFS